MPRHGLSLVLGQLHRRSESPEQPDSDSRLIARFVRGRDEAAFAALVRRHGPLVLGVCYRVLQDSHAAEDAFQATFLILVRRAASLREPRLLASWLHGVAHRTALRLRARLRREITSAELLEPAALTTGSTQTELREVLDAELTRLPSRFRRAIILTYFEGQSPDAVARVLQCAPTTVKTWLARGREQLRQRLVRRGINATAGSLAALLVPQRVTAAVPLSLRTSTLRLALVPGPEAASTAVAVSLAEGVLRTMLLTRMIPVLVVALAVTVSGGGLLLLGRATGNTAIAALPDEVQQPADVKIQRAAAAEDEWERKLMSLNDANWRAAFQVGGELVNLPPEKGFAILKKHWPRITKVDARQQLIKAWQFGATDPLRPQTHPRLLDVLDLGMRDPSPAVQSFALTYLQEIAFQDFAEDFEAYKKWFSNAHAKPLEDVRAASLVSFLEGMFPSKGDARTRMLVFLDHHSGVFQGQPKLRKVAVEQKLPEWLDRTIREEASTPEQHGRGPASHALRILAALSLDEPYQRRVMLPLLRPGLPQGVRAAAVHALGQQGNTWAIDSLRDAMIAGLKEEDRGLTGITVASAQALANIGDPRVIPAMIAVIIADDTNDTVYGVGYFGLGPLTGVTYDDTHNGAWWRTWWGKNRERFPPGVSKLDIPTLEKNKQVAAPPKAEVATDDVRDVPVLDLLVEKDAKKRYLLIGQSDRPPAGGYRLLVVLPGGDGSASFQPFLQRVHQNVLKEPWLLVQIVAPRWDEKQFDQVVWPTVGLPYPAARFTTETLIRDVVKDVGKRVQLDTKRIYLLGWSSGGPPCYATLLSPDSPVRGAFIAMSIFRPGQLPPLSNARGKRIYLLQSPEDTVTAFHWGERAARDLGDAGATVQLQRYEGGHGWIGDVWGMLRDGIAWLDRGAGSATSSP